MAVGASLIPVAARVAVLVEVLHELALDRAAHAVAVRTELAQHRVDLGVVKAASTHAFAIAVVTLVTSYIPYLGAILSGAFAREASQPRGK